MAKSRATYAICGAIKRNVTNPGVCRRPAGWGTAHPGAGHCKLHGGSLKAPSVSSALLTRKIMGEPVDIEPHEALLQCIRVAAGEVEYMTAMIQTIGTPEGAGYGKLVEQTIGGRQLNVWVTERHKAMDRLARWSKMALDAGVAERQVRLAEQYGGLIATLLGEVFAELRLSERQKQRAPEIVHRKLLALEAKVSA